MERPPAGLRANSNLPERMMSHFIGLDIGTTSVKAAVYDSSGACRGLEFQDYALDTPGVDRVELDPEHYWSAAVAVVRHVIADSGLAPEAIAALGVSSQGETLIVVDTDGLPIYPALVWLDNRAREEAGMLASKLGPEVYSRTGIPAVNPTWTACKIAWIRDHEPQIFRRAHKFLLAQNFIIHRLTGEYVTDGGVACTTLLLDICSHSWWQEALDATDLTVERLPALKRVGELAGGLTPQAASQMGLKAGVPVVLGGMDQIAGAVGAGNLTPEIVSESTGGALTIQVTVDRTDIDKEGQIPVYLHAVPGKYLFDPVCDTGGMTFKWFRDVFGEVELARSRQEGVDAYELLTELAGQAEPGCGGLVMLPHLTGAFSPEYDPNARGVFYGFTLAHRKPHFTRAVLEAVAFMLRRNLELVLRTGLEIKEIRATGGGARSRLWRQIKADVCNLPVVSLQHDDTALLGDAMLGAVATGQYDSLTDAAHAMVRTADRLEPRSEYRAVYDRMYEEYTRLFETLVPRFHADFG
jgi:sugar (pentulose or hexulose) kinase